MTKDGELKTTPAIEHLEGELSESSSARSCANCIKIQECVAFRDCNMFLNEHSKTPADDEFIIIKPTVLAMSCKRFVSAINPTETLSQSEDILT